MQNQLCYRFLVAIRYRFVFLAIFFFEIKQNIVLLLGLEFARDIYFYNVEISFLDCFPEDITCSIINDQKRNAFCLEETRYKKFEEDSYGITDVVPLTKKYNNNFLLVGIFFYFS